MSVSPRPPGESGSDCPRPAASEAHPFASPQDDTGPVLDSLLDIALLATGLSAGAVYCLDSGGNRFSLSAHRHLPAAFAHPYVEGLRTDCSPGSDEPLDLSDLWADPDRRPAAEVAGLRTQWDLPLCARGETVGVLRLFGTRPDPIAPDHLALLKRLGRHMALAILDARELEVNRSHRERLARLYSLSAEIASVTSLESALDLTVRHVASATGAHSAIVNVLDQDGRFVHRFGVDREGRELVDEPLPRKAGFTRTIQSTGRLVAVTGLRQEAEQVPAPERERGVRSFVGLPLRSGALVFGALFVRFDYPREFRPEEVRALELYADQAAGAITRLRLLEETRRRERELSNLLEVSRAISSTLELDEVLRRVATSMARALEMDDCAISSFDPDSRTVRTLADYSPDGQADLSTVGITFPLEDYPATARALERNEPLIVRATDESADPAEVAYLHRVDLGLVLMLPLHARGRPLGLAELYAKDAGRAVTADELELARALAEQAALAIENARLYATTQRWLRDQTLLYESGQELAAAQDPVAALAAVAERWVDRLGGHGLGYYVYDSDGGRFRKEYEFRDPRAGPCPPSTDEARPAADCPRLLAILEARTPQVLRAGDEALTQAERSLLRERNAQAMLVAPLVYANRAQGFLAVWHDVPGRDDLDGQLVRSFAGSAAVAIEKASLFQAERERTDELARSNMLTATLGQVAARLRMAPDPTAVLQTLGAELKRVDLNCSVASFSATDEALEVQYVSLDSGLLAEAERLTGLKAADIRIARDRLPRYRELIERRQPLFEQDSLAVALSLLPRFMWPVIRQALRMAGLRSNTPAIFVPLVVEDRVLGVFAVWGQLLRDTDLPSVSIFASQLAIAIENARLLEAERRRSAQLGLLFDVSRQLAGSLDEAEILQRAVTAMVHRLGYLEAAVMLAVSDGELELVAAAETDDMCLKLGHRQRVGEGLVGHVAETRATHLANDIAVDPYYFSPIGRTAGSALGLPLLREGHLLGVLYVESDQRGAFSPADVLALETLANHVATGQENARLYAGARRRLSEITALQSVTQTVASSLDLQTIFQTVVQLLQDTFGYRYVSIYQLDDDVLRLGAQVGYPPDRVLLEIPISRGVSGRTVRTGRPQFVPDVTRDGDFMAASPDVGSEICVPLLKGTAVLGTLNVESASSTPLTEVDVSLLTSIAGPVAVAIDNAQLFQAERNQRELAEALRAAGVALSSTLDLGEVLARLLEQVRRVVPYDSGNVMLAEGGHARIAHVAGYHEFGEAAARVVGDLSFEIADTPNLRQMFETGKPFIIPDVSKCPGWRDIGHLSHTRSWAGAPILAGGRLIGFFSLGQREPSLYRPEHAERLSAFAGQAALAIENALLYGETTRQATTDWLTGAYNRHHFQSQLPDELARARRLGYPVALLMVDLDHFKQLNDTYGHLQGDRALRQVAETLRAALRSHDSLYKYGGEEFAIILPGCGPHSLLDTAERLRQAVGSMHFEVQGVHWPITVSLGGTHLLDNGERTEDLIARADAALYRAKGEGRNRVCLA